MVTTRADTIDIDGINKEKFLSCTDAPANELLLFTLCNFEGWVGKFLPYSMVKVTSSLRKKSHHHGDGEKSNAIDFYLSSLYSGEECADIKNYLLFVNLLTEYLHLSLIHI